MKKYIKPETKFVQLRLFGSCLQDDYIFGGISNGVNNRRAASRKADNFSWDDEEEDFDVWSSLR